MCVEWESNGQGSNITLRFTEFLQYWIDGLESLVDFLSNLCTSKHDFTRNEYEQDDLWFDHTIDETREQLWLILNAVISHCNQNTFVWLGLVWQLTELKCP